MTLVANLVMTGETILSDSVCVVIGGFHLFHPSAKKDEWEALIDTLAKTLEEKGSTYYTCHCTGQKAYERMKAILGDHLNYLSTGTEIQLN